MKSSQSLSIAGCLAVLAFGCSSSPSSAPPGAAAGMTGAGAAGSGGAITGPPGSCAMPEVRITEIDVGQTIDQNEEEATLHPLAIAAVPMGGSRVSWMGSDGNTHVTTLNADDTVNTNVSVPSIPGWDYGDIFADDTGGVLLVTRDGHGDGGVVNTLNCGDPSNLCGTPPNPPIACYDMYMVRFDAGAETWATQLTQSSTAHPPYLNSKTDNQNVIFIWWYAHQGRIVSDGTNYAGYFGAAISVTQAGCVNIHQGDEMKVVSPAGAVLTG
ncbi:MAG TPA: hypothetical protein VGI10_12675, partial [Polyangiaceae bacterium]